MVTAPCHLGLGWRVGIKDIGVRADSLRRCQRKIALGRIKETGDFIQDYYREVNRRNRLNSGDTKGRRIFNY